MNGPASAAAGTRTSRGEWTEDSHLLLDGVDFLVVPDSEQYMSEDSSEHHFVVAKQPAMVDVMSDVVAALQPRRIVDLGIFKGGSTALLALMARPEKLTAVELDPEPVEALESFLTQYDPRGAVSCHYGLDQGDREGLDQLVLADHEDAPLDLVVDDASHLLRQTRTSFEVLFPRLRPGGMYMIEDWAWAHFPEPLWQQGGGYFHDRPALTNLIVELMMMVGTSTDLVADITVTHDIALIKRGPAAAGAPMRLEEHYCNRGLPFRPLL